MSKPYKLKIGKNLNREVNVLPDDSDNSELRWMIKNGAKNVLRFRTKEEVKKNLERIHQKAEEV